ncbi:hypothetical protein CPC16_002320, partial [Podila verticillata]
YGHGHGTTNRQTNRGDFSGSRAFSELPQYRSQVELNNSQSYFGSNNYNYGGNYTSAGERTSHHNQGIGSGDPIEKRRWSRGQQHQLQFTSPLGGTP